MPSTPDRDKPKGSKDDRSGISASAIDSKILCFRRWAFGAFTDLAKRSADSTDFGHGAHSMAEAYLEHGTIPDYTTKEGRALGKGLHLLPAPGSVLVETPFAFEVQGVLFDGFIDFRAPNWRGVGDHKFISTTSLKQPWYNWRTESYHDLVENEDPWYPIEPDEFKRRTQPNLYALACAVRARSDKTYCHWVWYPKSDREKHAVSTTVEIRAAEAQAFMFDEIMPHAIDMIETRKYFRNVPKHLRVLQINRSVPCNVGACTAYMKLCDFSEHCER
jgi:hypothetical protein